MRLCWLILILKIEYNYHTLNSQWQIPTSCHFYKIITGISIRLLAHTIHAGTYWKEFRTPVTSKTEHFVTIVMTFQKNVKGNPNSQGILNWIIQILHYYYSKQHKNIENSQIIEQNLVIFSFCPSLCLLRLVLPSPPGSSFSVH